MTKKPKKKKEKDPEKEKEKNKMKNMKEEIAIELGLEEEIAERGWANLTSRETGKIGGYISKKLREKKKSNTQKSGVRNQNNKNSFVQGLVEECPYYLFLTKDLDR
ncbi:MAG: small, acid-soluble spore protein, alpha/beta type [Bacillota bacterium]|nr:small, acid-soluble spore protein, alpha/beta type [Bacillota bacterium]